MLLALFRLLSTLGHVPGALELSASGNAILDKGDDLLEVFRHLADILGKRAVVFLDVLRIGRTCLQAGQPMLLGQAFGGYASAVGRQADRLADIRRDLLVLPLGGTAIGTGLGAAPGYRSHLYRHLRSIVGENVVPGDDMFDAMQNADTFSRVSAELRVCAEVLGKIASDFVLLSSDPGSGLGELRLPPVQVGSSIMPGKLNPVLPMMVQQVAFAVIGNDTTVSLACLQGQLEINHFEPVVATRLFDSLNLMTRATRLFADHCVAGIEPDRDRSLQNLLRSPAIATDFVAQIGYDEVSRLVKEADRQKRPFVELLSETELLSADDVVATVRRSTRYLERSEA